MKHNRNAILEFKCTGCGLCCKEAGFVFFTDDDIIRASKYLNISVLEFINKYLKQREAFSYYVQVTDTVPCIFLDSQNHCLIHTSKPLQCSTFPYWPDYTNSKGEVLARKFHRPCPGVKPKK